MKNCKTITLIIILLALGQAVFGQKKIIEESELDALLLKAEKLRENRSYRKETVIEKFDLNSLKLNFKSINLYKVLPPDRLYSSHFYKSPDKKTKTEYITIGDQRFGREDDGEWKAVQVINESVDENAYIETSVQVAYVRESKIRKKRASLYEKVRQLKLVEDGRQVHTLKYWFDKKGYLLKETLKIEYLDKAEIYTKRSNYDYDAIIKIEAPAKELNK